MQRTTTPTRGRLLAAAISLTAVPALALLAACGGGSSGGTTSTTAGAARAGVQLDLGAGRHLPGHRHRRQRPGHHPRPAQEDRLSLAPADTEILYAIGAGPQVDAVDDQSNYPAGRADDRSCPASSPTPRRSPAYEPDLVVLQRRQRHRRRARRKLKVPDAAARRRRRRSTRATPSTTTLGKATGHDAEAAEDRRSSVKDRIADGRRVRAEAGQGR